MIIGNSLDATYFSVYKRLDDSNEIVKANYCNGYNEFDGDDAYEFVGYEIENYIPDDKWDMSQDYKSDSINLLIECDYCEEHYVTSEQRRNLRASRYRTTVRNAGFDIEAGESDLYKDNCKLCSYEKIKDTMMFTQGFDNPFHSEKAKLNRSLAFGESGGVKTSKGQRYLADIFEGKLNVPIKNYSYYADIVVDNKIVIEYDGGGHNLSVLMGDITQEKFDVLERKRELDIIAEGYKIIRFVSLSEYFPEEHITKRIISEAMADLYLTDIDKIVITMGNKVNDPNYGKLQPIKKILEKSEFGGDNIEN